MKRRGASPRCCTTSITSAGRRSAIIPNKGAEILREKGYPEFMIRAILSHATEITGVTRDSRLEKTLFACDELAGFITAASLVRPSKSILDLEAKSVVKRMKDKAFAKGVKREDLHEGAALLGLTARGAHRQHHRFHARQGRRARAERHAVADLLGPLVRISN